MYMIQCSRNNMQIDSGGTLLSKRYLCETFVSKASSAEKMCSKQLGDNDLTRNMNTKQLTF